ncbi:MAG: hypothetical protein HY245_08770 [Rhizobiales bacterium]|nr:hypothetical protein [Hyphomicrobiales bacterium]MBI3673496.1 hypothetical protein [Hyphomicrobiales bacterium]
MIHTILNAPWSQFYDVMADGQPPMILRILLVNTLFFILFVVRRARGVRAMRQSTAIKVQALLVVSNMLILFQSEVQQVLGRFI